MYLLTLILVLSAFGTAVVALAGKCPVSVPVFLVAFFELFQTLVGK